MPDKKSGYLSDYRAEKDSLNFSIFQPALRNILQNADTPLTVGVFGTWGTGKTSLLQMLKKELDDKDLASLKTVWFTAWKYEQQEALWRAFMLRVIDGLHPRKADGTRFQPEDFGTPAEIEKREGLLHLGRLERSIYETVNWQEQGQWSLDTGELVKQGAKLPIWLALHLAGLKDAAKDLGLNPDLAKLLEREVREHHLNQLNSMEQFAAEFEKAVQLILGKEGRLVIFVDDLDRCLPEKAVEVLEAIKLFLDVPGTVFVLGMDREIIRRGIETHYGAMLKTDSNDEIPINGDVYLQKLIQIPFNLPPMDLKSRVDFIANLEIDLPDDFHLDDLTRQVFALGLYPNPRQVKRALNIFFLLKQIAREQEKRGLIPKDLLAYPLLAKTVLIQSQWPELYKLWRQYPTLIQTLEDEYTRQPVSEDELLRGLGTQDLPEIAQEGAGKKTDRQATTHTAARLPVTGILAPYLNERQKFALLAEMLRFPEETGDGARRARFGGLKRIEVQIYVGLAGAFEQTAEESAQPSLSLSSDWLSELESGDPVKIREILAAVSEREPDPAGPQHSALRGQLVTIAQNPGLPAAARVSTADLADELGYTPDDLFQFVPVSSDNVTFHIAKYPVTNAQYARFLKPENFTNDSFWRGFPRYAGPEKAYEKIGDWGSAGWEWLDREKNKFFKQMLLRPRYWQDPRFGVSRANVPVVGLSWYEANAYCKWLLANWAELQEGRQGLAKPAAIRLPTEAEWVLAAGGEQGDGFAFGELMNPDQEITRYANTTESDINRTTPVWMYPQGISPCQVMDMSGNVLEWQANCYDKGLNTLASRGGCWGFIHVLARVSYRSSDGPGIRGGLLGFRVVLAPHP